MSARHRHHGHPVDRLRSAAGPMLLALFALARPVAAADAVDRHPGLQRLAPTEEVWIDKGRRRVVVGGAIALDRGPIEVLACPRQTKEHEAIVALAASGRGVHAALLAIGLEPGHPVSFDPEYTPATGPRVGIIVRWAGADGRVEERSARDLVRHAATGQPLAVDWVFAGSVFWRDPADGRDHYQADGGDVICVSNFPTAMLDLPIESPDANESLAYEVFPGRVPPRGTPVELVLSAAD